MSELANYFAEQHARHQKNAEGVSLFELFEEGLKEGDIITATVTSSWITKGRRYKIGKRSWDLLTVQIGELFNGKKVVYDLHQGMESRLWENEFEKENSALKSASEHGNLEVVKYLVEQGADIHEEDDMVLQLASENGHRKVVEYLIEKGANIHANNDWALMVASRDGHLDVVEYLVESGADIHAREDEALEWASENGHLDVVEYLVEQGVDADNAEALKAAYQWDHLEVVKHLIGEGADSDVLDMGRRV